MRARLRLAIRTVWFLLLALYVWQLMDDAGDSYKLDACLEAQAADPWIEC